MATVLESREDLLLKQSLECRKSSLQVINNKYTMSKALSRKVMQRVRHYDIYRRVRWNIYKKRRQ
jgi:hypothetical protein